MSEFFLKIVNMSISASWIVLAVLVLRLLLKKAPKWVNVLLWGIVAVRLVCPFSLESALSLIPSAETVSPQIMMDRTPHIDSGVPVINQVVNPIISGSFAPQPMASANPLQILIPVAANFWVLGILILLAYTFISYWRIRRKVRTAVLLKENIFQSENVVSPFVLGIMKPKIYLPFHMNSQDMSHVIAHEQAHICRKDHWWKPIGFLILSVYWFNPLLWLGYVLLCRDIELACDEKVVKEFDTAQKADYSQALLSCSVNRRMIAACPLAFGEVGVKNRVKSVLNYKKPAFWLIVVAILVSIAVAVCFLTNPPDRNKDSDLYVSNMGGVDGPGNVVLVPSEIPKLIVIGNKDVVRAGTGTSSWTYKKEDGTYAGISADSNHPLTMKDTMPVLTMYPGIFSHTNPHTAWLMFTAPGELRGPDQVTVRCWKLDGTEETSVEVTRENLDISIIVEADRIYEITAVWSGSSTHSGTARYHFRTEMPVSSGIVYPEGATVFEVTPSQEIERNFATEKFVYRKAHYLYRDQWFAEGHTYKYRLVLTGRMHNAAMDTTYVVLSNTEDITFDMAWKAAGYSSNSEDYFDPAVAMIVGSRLFE